MALLHVRATYAHFRSLKIICSSHWKTYMTLQLLVFWLTVRARKARRGGGGGGGGRSLARAFPTPIKKITIDLEDEDMQWPVIYNAFASNERAFAQSRQSIFYSH